MTINNIETGKDMPITTNEVTEDELVFLALALTPVPPPAPVFDRVLKEVNDRIDSLSSDAASPSLSSLRTVRRNDGEWRAMAPNVTFKVLHDDGAFASMLVHLLPGAALPPHAHPGDEECYVVRGDIWLSGVHLQAGDFQFAGTDVIHDGIHSETGCLLHIRASSEMIAAASLESVAQP